jgi:hypothetical protein
MTMQRLHLLTGAPHPACVTSEYKDTLVPAFKRYLELEDDQTEVIDHFSPKSGSSFTYPKWRVITIERSVLEEEMRTSHSQPYLDQSNTRHVTPTEETKNFLNHSYTQYSQDTDKENLSISFLTSSPSIESSPSLPKWVVVPSAIIDIMQLPTSHTVHILPPHITFSLLVAVISRPSSQCVTVRKTGKMMHIQSLLVADETCAGFTINFWTSSDLLSGSNQAYAALLPTLRPRDILLIQDITLGTWNNVVYGQSIHPSRGKTKVNVLERDGLMLVELTGNTDKVNRVSYWMRNNLIRNSKHEDADLPSDSLPHS